MTEPVAAPNAVKFFVTGKPEAMKAQQMSENRIVFPTAAYLWREHVRRDAVMAMAGSDLFQCPVSLRLTFYIERHYGPFWSYIENVLGALEGVLFEERRQLSGDIGRLFIYRECSDVLRGVQVWIEESTGKRNRGGSPGRPKKENLDA